MAHRIAQEQALKNAKPIETETEIDKLGWVPRPKKPSEPKTVIAVRDR